MGRPKIPSAVLQLASRKAKVVKAERHEAPPPPSEEPEPQLWTRRTLVRQKIVTGLRKLHPMD